MVLKKGDDHEAREGMVCNCEGERDCEWAEGAEKYNAVAEAS